MVESFDTETVLALLGSNRRRGHWEPPDEVRVIACMGGAEIDLREADLLEGTTRIVCLALMGGVKIIVPTDVEVSARGMGLMGGFPIRRHRPPDPGAPRVEVRGLALMGGVDLRIVRPRSEME